MRALLLPLVLAVLGIGAGLGAGWFLKPTAAVDGMTQKEDAPDAKSQADKDASNTNGAPEKSTDPEELGSSEFVKLNNQFIVPVVNNDAVSSLVVMSLSLEVETGLRAEVYAKEPKLRDTLLQVLFDHANIGGFDGAFTEANNLKILRSGLTDAARQVVPGTVFGVLIGDLARQDL